MGPKGPELREFFSKGLEATMAYVLKSDDRAHGTMTPLVACAFAST